MPNFDHMLDAVRADCDVNSLASSAELRRLGGRRTTIHRAVGGAATLTAVAGLATGLALYGPSSGTSHTIGAASPSTTVTAPVNPPVASSPVPSSTPATPSSAPAISTTHTTTCAAGSFDTAHAKKYDDDAAGIIGFDIHLKYQGAARCKFTEPPRLSYTDSAGHKILIPTSTETATPFWVKPGATVLFTVFGHDHNGENPLPPSCNQPTTYRGLSVRIDGHDEPLPGLTVTLPCAGPATTPWSLA